MKRVSENKFNKFNVIVFSNGECKGQWGFESQKEAESFAEGMKSGESFGKGVDFVASVFERKATFFSKE
jgi:hypothetical protein